MATKLQLIQVQPTSENSKPASEETTPLAPAGQSPKNSPPGQNRKTVYLPSHQMENLMKVIVDRQQQAGQDPYNKFNAVTQSFGEKPNEMNFMQDF